MAVKLVIEPIFEADFTPHSYGFRPKRLAHDAIDDIANALWAGHTQVIDADLSSYFDTIPHANLMAVVAERIVDGAILALLKQWLKAPVIGVNDQGKRKTVGGGKANRVGTPQGGVISPLLSNLYLHLLDRIWDRHRLKQKLGAHIVRYADDFVVLCKQGVEEPLKVVRHVMDRLGLTLNETKTHVVDAKESGFNFLGFTLQMSQGTKTGKWYPNVRPSDKAVGKIMVKVTDLTRRELTCIPLDDVVGSVNRSLRGWAGYFHFRNSSLAMSKVRNHAEQRLRIHLRKRHKVKNWKAGYAKFPSRDLYDRHGLHQLPKMPGWKTAHASV
jgi:RNA-directed DNA polymerase